MLSAPCWGMDRTPTIRRSSPTVWDVASLLTTTILRPFVRHWQGRLMFQRRQKTFSTTAHALDSTPTIRILTKERTLLRGSSGAWREPNTRTVPRCSTHGLWMYPMTVFSTKPCGSPVDWHFWHH